MTVSVMSPLKRIDHRLYAISNVPCKAQRSCVGQSTVKHLVWRHILSVLDEEERSCKTITDDWVGSRPSGSSIFILSSSAVGTFTPLSVPCSQNYVSGVVNF